MFVNKKKFYLIFILALVISCFFIYASFLNIINKTKIIEDKKEGEYSEETANSSKMGTTIYDSNLVYEGYTTIDGFVIDNNGYIIKKTGGHLISFFSNKDYIIKNHENLDKYNSTGSLLWKKPYNIHHELFISEDQSLALISKEIEKYKIENIIHNVEFDVIYHLTSNGSLIEKYSLFEHINEFHSMFPDIFDFFENNIKNTPINNNIDYFHLNSIQIIPNNTLGKIDKRFQKDNWLISLNNQRLMLILDKNDKSIVWSYSPNSNLHGPRMQPNGNILYFHNGGNNCSKVYEINPINKSIIWEYNDNCSINFFSKNRGFAQRLPNNNILITDSSRGRVFEITKEKEIIWEWFYPKLNTEQQRHTIYRAIRVEKKMIE